VGTGAGASVVGTAVVGVTGADVVTGSVGFVAVVVDSVADVGAGVSHVTTANTAGHKDVV
jgi:hypothetical protein